jgi:hypothetical protein
MAMHNRYMLVLFPICYDKWNYINKIIEQNEIIIEKKKVKWAAIERDFTRTLSDGSVEKVMSRKTIAKYFTHLMN